MSKQQHVIWWRHRKRVQVASRYSDNRYSGRRCSDSRYAIKPAVAWPGQGPDTRAEKYLFNLQICPQLTRPIKFLELLASCTN